MLHQQIMRLPAANLKALFAPLFVVLTLNAFISTSAFAILFSNPSAEQLAAFKQYQAAELAKAKKRVEGWKAAAEKGDASAQVSLGNYYWVGHYEPRDFHEALKWYRMAADQGNAEAQASLGGMYERGEFVKQDHVEAETLLKRAADQNSFKGQFQLAELFYNKGDNVEAYYWFSIARQPIGQYSAGRFLTTEQKQDIENRVKEWQKEHTYGPPAPHEH